MKKHKKEMSKAKHEKPKMMAVATKMMKKGCRGK
jgi:hypothetical protein